MLLSDNLDEKGGGLREYEAADGSEVMIVLILGQVRSPISESDALEIRPICLRQRHHFIMQEIRIVVGADVLLPFAVDAPESLLRIPWCREGARILNVDRDVDRVAAVG